MPSLMGLTISRDFLLRADDVIDLFCCDAVSPLLAHSGHHDRDRCLRKKGEYAMVHNKHGQMTRRTLLKVGTALPLVGIAAPNVLAQPLSKSPTKVLDFETYADVAKAEQE